MAQNQDSKLLAKVGGSGLDELDPDVEISFSTELADSFVVTITHVVVVVSSGHRKSTVLIMMKRRR